MDTVEKIFKKNNALLILFLTIFFIIVLGTGIYINIEANSAWLNYNVLLNSVLENTRSLYLGFNDGILQLYSCEKNIKPEIKIEMTNYLNSIPSVIFSFPFSFCLSNFDFRDITNNNYYDYLSTDRDRWIINSFTNISSILENVESCMKNILIGALSQESTFLLEPIIVSKKQMWAIHQKMRKYSTNMPNEEFEFGQNTLICNYSLQHDLEGSPRITGVLVNGSEYQAPLFRVDTKLTDIDHDVPAYSGIDILIEEEVNQDQELVRTRIMNKSKLYFSEFNLLSQELEGKTFPNHLREFDQLNNLHNTRERVDFFANSSCPKSMNDLNSIVHDDDSKSAYTRTIYIPTSSILSIIEVFSEGMKELERNSSNNLDINIILIQLFTLINLFVSLLLSILIFIPLILMENEKEKKIFSSYGSLIIERYQYFWRKYSQEIDSSLGEFYSSFEKLFNIIHTVTESSKKVITFNKKMNENQDLGNINSIELNIVYKQLIGILQFKLYYICKFSILSSFCFAIINDHQHNFNTGVIDKSSTNMNSMLEIISKLIEIQSQQVEVKTKTCTKKVYFDDYFKSILIYIVVSNLVYSINSIKVKNKKIRLDSDKKTIILSVIFEEDNSSTKNHLILPNLLDNFRENQISKNFDECFEEFKIDNSWFNSLIEKLNLEFLIKTNYNEMQIDISIRNDDIQMSYHSSKNKLVRDETSGNGSAFVIILENLNLYQNYIIENECLKMGINFFRTNFSNLNLISTSNFDSFVIFADKMFIKLEELIKKISKMTNDQSRICEVIIFWLENDEATLNHSDYNNTNQLKLEELDSSNLAGTNNYHTKSSNNFGLFLNNNNAIIIQQASRIVNFSETKISQYYFRKPLSHSDVNKLLSKFAHKKTQVDLQFLPKNSPVQNFINVIDKSVNLQLSTKNFLAKSFAIRINELIYNDKHFYSDEKSLRLTKEHIKKTATPIKDIKQFLSIYSTNRPNDWKRNFSQDSVELNFVNPTVFDRDFDYKTLTTNLLCVSEDELMSLMRNSIGEILSSSLKDKISERVELLLDFWKFIRSNTFTKDGQLLQYYCPQLALHCIIVLKILIKNSISLIQNVVSDLNNVLALIVSFLSVSFIKRGISTNSISFLNEFESLEIQVCNILENIFFEAKFSSLFDDFERCKKLISVNILSTNEDISFGIKKWIGESVNEMETTGANFKFCEPIINSIAEDKNVFFISILFNTSKLTLTIFDSRYSF